MKKSNQLLIKEICGWSIESGKKQSCMADILGISKSTFYRIKSDPGRVSLEDLRVILKLSKASDETILKIIKG